MYSNKFIALQIFGLILAVCIAVYHPSAFNISPLLTGTALCPEAAYVDTIDHGETQYLLRDREFREFAVERFSRAIQVDTTIDESLEDYSKFAKFHRYLETEFPLVFERALVTKVNEYGLLFEFMGENPELKPVLFMAHQDTVPFGNIEDWVHDPLAGYYDDTKIYGRGTNDVKGLLVGLMGAMDAILKKDIDHVFQRTVIFSFGFDEEISGLHGAAHLSEHLLKKYGPKSIDHILDEGAPMFVELNGKYFGLVVTAEKGYTDLIFEVNAPGGHSSNPRDSTSIGILAQIVHEYEKHKFNSFMPNESPMLNLLECTAEHGNTSFLVKVLSKLARVNSLAKKLLIGQLSHINLFEYSIKTSQAVDVIRGGDKYNSLPRNASVVVNHRIAIGNDFNTVLRKALKYAEPVAKQHNMGLIFNGTEISPANENGVVKIYTLSNTVTSPSPITPSYDEHWFRLTGYMKTFYEKEVFPGLFDNNTYIISPTTMQGNTDTRHYWQLTDHIYRSQPGCTNILEANMHGNNEYLHIDSHLQMIAFYYNYILGIC